MYPLAPSRMDCKYSSCLMCTYHYLYCTQVQRRNYPMAIERSNYRNRGANYSDKGRVDADVYLSVPCVRHVCEYMHEKIQIIKVDVYFLCADFLGVAMRCVRKDQSSITNTLHYLTNGSCTIR